MRPVLSLAADDELDIQWAVSGDAEQIVRMKLELSGQLVSPVQAERVVQIQSAGFKQPDGKFLKSDAILENDQLRLTIPQTAEGYGSGWVDYRKGGEWHRLGALPYLSYLITKDSNNQQAHHHLICADQFELINTILQTILYVLLFLQHSDKAQVTS